MIKKEKIQSNALMLLLISLALLFLTVALFPIIEDMQLQALCLFSVVVAAVSWFITITVSQRKSVSFPGAYIGVFIVFHFGLAFAYAVGHDIVAAYQEYRHFDWFFSHETKTALVLSSQATMAFAVGVCLSSVLRDFRKKHKKTDVKHESLSTSNTNHDYNMLGFLLTAVSVFTWFLIIVKYDGLVTIVSPYSEFLDTTKELPLKFTYFGIGLGLTLVSVGQGTVLRKWCFSIFGIWALISFPLGLRGEVLFPLVGAVVVASLKAPVIKLRWLAVFILVILSVISVAKVVRQSGLSGELTTISISSTNPLNALAELGGSLRPVTETVRWITQGESPIYGTSYWAPFERGFQRIVPLWDRIPSREDHRLLNMLVQYRVSPIGYSPVAEAYYNFKQLGPIIFFGLLGMMLGWIDQYKGSIANQLTGAVIIVPLLINIRNAFTQVPGQLVSGAAIVIIYSIVVKSLKNVKESK